MDLFDLIGPVMIGPSSSHTAGAARIGLTAYSLLGERVVKADVGLHGSFAKTYRGHGTDRAIVGGLLDGYGRIGCFLDRDEAGRRTLAALTMRYGERVTDRSSLYDGCKDLNEYLQLTTKKQKNNHLKIEEQ